jgi:SWIM zinc finger
MEALMMNRGNMEDAKAQVRKVAVRTEPVPESLSTAGKVTALRPHLPLPRSIPDRDESDPDRCALALVQRGRLIVDVSMADLEAAEVRFGPFHPTTWHFRNALNEAQCSWERLRAELGTKLLESALHQPPLTTLTLGEPANGTPRVVLILIAGQTYRSQRVAGTELAPIQWRLTRLNPPLENGPYYACRLADGSTQCDCADWTYQIAQSTTNRKILCKHLAALAALGWI